MNQIPLCAARPAAKHAAKPNEPELFTLANLFKVLLVALMMMFLLCFVEARHRGLTVRKAAQQAMWFLVWLMCPCLRSCMKKRMKAAYDIEAPTIEVMDWDEKVKIGDANDKVNTMDIERDYASVLTSDRNQSSRTARNGALTMSVIGEGDRRGALCRLGLRKKRNYLTVARNDNRISARQSIFCRVEEHVHRWRDFGLRSLGLLYFFISQEQTRK